MNSETIDFVEDKGQPVKYTVMEKSLVGNEIFGEGATCFYEGLPAENLKPMCDIGEARYQRYLASNRARQVEMNAQYAEQAAGLGDSAGFAKAIADAVAAGVTQALAAVAGKGKKEPAIA